MWKERWEERLKHQPGGWEGAQEIMKQSNPALIPRNHRVEEVLRAAVQDGDYGPLRKFLQVLQDPFAHSPEQEEFAHPPKPTATPYRTFCGT